MYVCGSQDLVFYFISDICLSLDHIFGLIQIVSF